MAQLSPPLAGILLAALCMPSLGCGERVVVGAIQATEEAAQDQEASEQTDEPDTVQAGPEEPSGQDEPSEPEVSLSETACTFFVQAGAVSPGDGSSWATATPSLSAALDQGEANLQRGACDNIELRLTAGIYTSGDPERNTSFSLYGKLTMRGGYEGNTSAPDARNLSTEETILSGDIGTPGQADDNSYHVVRFIDDPTAAAHLDGLIIEGGYADGPETAQDGAGLWVQGAHLQLTDTVIRNNYAERSGGGMYIVDGQVSENRTRWFSNRAGMHGGAIYAENARAYPYDVLIEDNEAERGGGLYIQGSPEWHLMYGALRGNRATDRGGALFDSQSSQLKLCRTTFDSNQAGTSGGAVYTQLTDAVNMASSVWLSNRSATGASLSLHDVEQATLTNLTMTANEPEVGGFNLDFTGLGNYTLANTILWQNSQEHIHDAPLTVSHSIVPEGYVDLTTNLAADPGFRNPPGESIGVIDLSLRADSPAIDSGDNEAVEDFCGNDVSNNPRVVGGQVDRGAFERGG